MKEGAPRLKARVKVTLRARGGRRLVIESFGRRTPTFVAVGGGDHPEGAWLSPRELRRLADTARRILR